MDHGEVTNEAFNQVWNECFSEVSLIDNKIYNFIQEVVAFGVQGLNYHGLVQYWPPYYVLQGVSIGGHCFNTDFYTLAKNVKAFRSCPKLFKYRVK